MLCYQDVRVECVARIRVKDAILCCTAATGAAIKRISRANCTASVLKRGLEELILAHVQDTVVYVWHKLYYYALIPSESITCCHLNTLF